MDTTIKTSKNHRACLPPFSRYKSKGPYRGVNGRLLINLLGDWGGSTRKTFLYARYLLAVHHATLPPSGMDVDHIDNNAFNDTIPNLQWLPHIENIRKGKEGPCLVRLSCPHCSRVFVVDKRNSHLSKRGQAASYCSRSCSFHSSKYRGLVQEYTLLNSRPSTDERVVAFEDWEKFSIPITSCNLHLYCTNGKNTSLTGIGDIAVCRVCEQDFETRHSGQSCCSTSCARSLPQPKKVTDEDVKSAVLRILSGVSNWCSEGKRHGVSDSALRKRARYLGLLKK